MNPSYAWMKLSLNEINLIMASIFYLFKTTITAVLITQLSSVKNRDTKQGIIVDMIENSSKPGKELTENAVDDTVRIGQQIWMTYNLDVKNFQNGDTIFHATTNEEWLYAGENKIPAWCYYNNNKKREIVLYNWYAVGDSRGLAPAGWKIPSKPDWSQLINHLGGLNLAAVSLMSKTGWKNEQGLNTRGFNAYPDGGRFKNGNFDGLLNEAYYWSLNEQEKISDKDIATCLSLNYHLTMLTQFPKYYGLSVRCIKN